MTFKTNKLRDAIRGTTSNDDRARKIAALYDGLVPKSAFGAPAPACAASIAACLQAVEDDRSTFLPATNFPERVDGWSGY